MKKTLTILMALLMLCSMVMCVSAAEYEGKGFTIEVPDEYSYEEYEVNEGDEGTIGYFISANDENVNSEVEISVIKSDDPKAEFEEISKGLEITQLDGKPAIIDKWEDGPIFITTYTDNYIYSIDCEGDVEGAEAAFEIVKTMKFTDVIADDADNQDDTTTIGAIEENTPNTTVLIAVIAVAAVLIVAGVVIIVVFTKKKKNN